MVKEGDLIQLKNGKKAIVTSGNYTYRKMEAEDYEMERCGMGEYAGTYCTAFNVIYPDTGSSGRIIYSDTKFDIISEVGETL